MNSFTKEEVEAAIRRLRTNAEHWREAQKTADILRQWGSNYSKMNVFKLAKLIQELYYFLTKGREYESNEL